MVGSAPLDQLVIQSSRKHGVDPRLVRAIITHESGWDPEAVSRAGAIGLMQLMPGTADLLGVDPHDPAQNIEGGVRYVAGLLDSFGGNLDAALVGYVGGPDYAARWLRGEAALYGEVRGYVDRVKQSYAGTRP